MSVYVIAEAGINHNGSVATACALASAAKRCGADAVKFQTYETPRICCPGNPEFAWLKKCELSRADFLTLKAYCDGIGIDFLSTPDTLEDAQFLDTLGMKWMKIGSGNNSLWFLRSLSDIKTRLLVSLGMGREASVEADYMHCVSSYPCPLDQANMARIDGEDIIGFSDHTIGSLCAVMAVARGATIIEKHFTLDRSQEGPDHHMSADPDEFATYVRQIRLAEQALGDGAWRVMPCEQKTIAQLEARK